MADREIPTGCVAVPISEQEQRVRALELADVIKQMRTLDDEWATVKKKHAEKLTGLEQRMERLADDVRTGTEIRDAQGNLWDAETLRAAVADEDDDEPHEGKNGKANGNGSVTPIGKKKGRRTVQKWGP